MRINRIKNHLFVFLSLCYFSNISAQIKPLKIEKLNNHLYIYQTYNIYNEKEYSANALYLVTKKGVVLFDVPWQKSQYQVLVDSIQQKHSKKVIAVFATHSHEDRAGDLSFFNKKGIKTFATQKTNEYLKNDKRATSNQFIKIGKTYKIGGEKFKIDFVGEGHTKDNIIVWFPDYEVLDGGCLVKSSQADNLGYLGEANIEAWPASINQILEKYPKIKLVIPGHDDWQKQGHLERTLYLLNFSNN